MTDLLEIGRFATLSGLTIAALRHYDEVDVLKPAEVDANTSYRRYRPEQVETARLICRLRSVDLPVDEVREIVAVQDPAVTRGVLQRHQERLAARSKQVQEMLETSAGYLEQGVPMPPPAEARPVQVMLATRNRQASIAFYRELFGWRFVDEVSSFMIGAYDTPSFFLVTIENWLPDDGPTCFGLLVADVDDTHRHAIELGAVEIEAPADYAWKPRSSIIDDPSGNRIQLAQA